MRACLIAWLCVLFALAPLRARAMSDERRMTLRNEVKDMFRHGFVGYMTHAFPADELRPLTCKPLLRDPDPKNIGVNDIHANASITLVDTLSALPLILPEEFPGAVEKVATMISFDQDVKVQVFEMTIRALGALLSTYQRLDGLPTDPKEQAAALGLKGSVDVKRWAPRILELAVDLGNRLVPAFKSPTGLPYARINLRKGVEKGEGVETCTAGAGSLVLEFSLLSRLTGDDQFEAKARHAFMRLWNSRTPQDLVGNGIAVSHGHWLGPGLSGVNAGIDSFFEYALKAAIMLDDSTYMDVFHDAYAAIQTHIRTVDGFFWRQVHLRGLKPASPAYIDSLSSFFPGVQVLAGDVESAIRGHLIFWNLWRKYDGIPESWEPETRQIGWAGWPGRPEFIESTYYLHRATGDDFYLRVGERVLKDILRRTVTRCGFASLTNVETGATEDRMESFMLSETLKYLYLLFDPTPAPAPSNTVFTTEGHPMYMPYNLTTPPTAAWRANHRGEDLFCPVYTPQTMGGLPVGIEGRDDYDYARALVFGSGEEGVAIEEPSARALWSEEGTCALPHVPNYSFEIVLAPAGAGADFALPAHDASPGLGKVYQTAEGDWVITDIDGLRLGVRWRMDGFGYDVTNIGPHRVRYGQLVTIVDVRMDGYLPAAPRAADSERPTDLTLSFSRSVSTETLISATGTPAMFGHTIGAAPVTASGSGSGRAGPADTRWSFASTPLVVAPKRNNPTGCVPMVAGFSPKPKDGEPFVVLVQRGGCSFLAKALHAVRAGAVGVIVADAGPSAGQSARVRPNADGEPDDLVDEVEDLGLVFVDESAGRLLKQLIQIDRITVAASPVEGQGVAMPASERREGRLVVGDHELVNLRVADPL